jgi:uncharacterized membrane protein YcaP (DUF421 family)
MWNDMLALQASVFETILPTVLVYVAVVILIRVKGKRGLAEMSTFDIVVAFLLAEIVGRAAGGDDDNTSRVPCWERSRSSA